MAILQDAFNASESLGLKMLPAGKEDREKYVAMQRQEYITALYDARKLFLEEKLFIPVKIAECTRSTLGAALKEKNLHDIFFDHHELGVRQNYSRELPVLLESFNTGMDSLEQIMREHIEGTKLRFLADQAQGI